MFQILLTWIGEIVRHGITRSMGWPFIRLFLVVFAKLLPRIYHKILSGSLKHLVRQLLFGEVKLRDVIYQVRLSESSMFKKRRKKRKLHISHYCDFSEWSSQSHRSRVGSWLSWKTVRTYSRWAKSLFKALSTVLIIIH